MDRKRKQAVGRTAKHVRMRVNYQIICNAVVVCVFFTFGGGAYAGDVPTGAPVPLPFTVYTEKGDTNNHYIPSGWMGNMKGIRMDEGWPAKSPGGNTCCRFEYSEPGDWAGIAWQDSANDWGDRPGGWNLTGAKKLTFWARGENGGERVTFKFGIIGSEKKYRDSSEGEIDNLKLTKRWKRYSIKVSGKDLSRIKTGFAWALNGQGQRVVFYLADIKFE
ncbi:MAG TPA: hypothetical protein VMF08_09415 [Candidatus Sulfotelmatobacter sp.]|nr:hypothetical protein [Candidatus Sulfotelmatobacter sp.]